MREVCSGLPEISSKTRLAVRRVCVLERQAQAGKLCNSVEIFFFGGGMLVLALLTSRK